MNYSAEKASSAVTIKNSAPTFPASVSLSPAAAYKNTKFTCSASGSTDADGDGITYYYEFRKPGKVLQKYSKSNQYTCKSNCNKNDDITCYSKAKDGDDYSAEKPSNPIKIQ